jgi:hypothetical protein
MKISQREAIRLRKLVHKLEREADALRNRWASDWEAGWVNIATLEFSPESHAKVKTARLLGHAVILLPEANNMVRVYADRIP